MLTPREQYRCTPNLHGREKGLELTARGMKEESRALYPQEKFVSRKFQGRPGAMG